MAIRQPILGDRKLTQAQFTVSKKAPASDSRSEKIEPHR